MLDTKSRDQKQGLEFTQTEMKIETHQGLNFPRDKAFNGKGPKQKHRECPY